MCINDKQLIPPLGSSVSGKDQLSHHFCSRMVLIRRWSLVHKKQVRSKNL